MQFEIDDVVFTVTLEEEYTLIASTETPFCRDVSYLANIDSNVDELTTALKNKAVTGSYDDSYLRLTLRYGDTILNLYYDDEDVYEPFDFITKLKNYHKLTKDMLELRKEFEKMQAMYNNLNLTSS